MFTAEILKQRLHRAPFVPFRIHMSDGSSYEVTHPEAAFVLRYGVEVGLDLDASAVPGKAVFCAMIRISRIEEIASAKNA